MRSTVTGVGGSRQEVQCFEFPLVPWHCWVTKLVKYLLQLFPKVLFWGPSRTQFKARKEFWSNDNRKWWHSSVVILVDSVSATWVLFWDTLCLDGYLAKLNQHTGKSTSLPVRITELMNGLMDTCKHQHHCFATITCWLAPAVKNWRILLEQSFTACIRYACW